MLCSELQVLVGPESLTKLDQASTFFGAAVYKYF